MQDSSPPEYTFRKITSYTMQPAHAKEAITAAATPSSSARTVSLVVTPVLLEYAILMRAATRPPNTVFPNNFRVCVLLLRATSVPSRGWRESAEINCSVASVA